jgi:hypothetical protein
MAEEMSGVFLVIRRIIAVVAGLSVGIYKICTSPSTGFVEKPWPRDHAIGREAAPVAVFRGIAHFPS